MRRVLYGILTSLLLCIGMLAQQLTVVTGSVYVSTGSVTAVAAYQFTTADGYVVQRGQQYTAPIQNGSFSIALPPNAGGTPANTYYNVTYVYRTSQGAPGSTATEVWIVPQSSTPVDVGSVRGTAGPVTTNLAIAFNQVTPPANCAANGGIVQYNGSQYVCTTTLTNPMTSVGDMLVGGAGGTPARVAAGTSGYLWTANGPGVTPSWNPAPSGMVYPGVGVANSTGSGWGTSYSVGVGANDLVQLDATGALPALSAAHLTGFPTLNQNTTGNAATASACATTNGCWPNTAAAINALGPFTFGVQASQLPNPGPTTLGGIESFAAVAHEWIDSISTAGVPHASRPACADLSDATLCNATSTGSGAVVEATSPTLVTPNLGTPSLLHLDNADRLPCAALPARTGDATASAGSCAMAVATMTGDSGSGGAKGLVPAPAAGDAAAGKYLKANGTWAVPPAGSGGGGAVFVQKTIQAGDTIAASGTGTYTAFATTASFSAGAFCGAGVNGYRFSARGTLAMTSGNGPSLEILLGSAVLTVAHPYLGYTSGTQGWTVEGEIVCDTTGASGTVEAHGHIFYANSAVNQSGLVFSDQSNTANTATFSVDTTAAQTLTIEVDKSTFTGTVVQRSFVVIPF